MLVVFTTTPSDYEANDLAEKIVSSRLAACVQILPTVKSVYLWEGRLEREPEHLLLIKTLDERFDELSAFITANHRYDVPEIVAVEAERVSEAYLAWMRELLG